jgi:hypothetical protein
MSENAKKCLWTNPLEKWPGKMLYSPLLPIVSTRENEAIQEEMWLGDSAFNL